MGDRLVIMSDGKIEQVGTPHEVFSQPKTLFVAEFLGDNNIFRGKVAGVDGKKATIETDKGFFAVETDRRIPGNGKKTAFAIRADLASDEDISGDDNRIGATVRLIEYQGFYVTLRLELEDGSEFLMKESQDKFFRDPHAEGEKVTIRWTPRDAVLLPGAEKHKRLYI
jgi:ABC-type Fe3+/spermidine/putrescine transport system ATPase subunit